MVRAIVISLMFGNPFAQAISSSDLVKKIEALGPLKGAERAEAVHRISGRIKDASEETVTQTYLKLSDPAARNNLLSVVAEAAPEDCRYTPLLMTIVQFDIDARVRGSAAGTLIQIRSFRGPFRESAIVYAIGDALSREENKYTADNMASALDKFLQTTCGVNIGATKDTGKTTTLLGSPMRVHRTSVDAVKEWWTREGRAQALARKFDKADVGAK